MPDKQKTNKAINARLIKRLAILAALLIVLIVAGVLAFEELTDMSRFDISFYELMDDKITGDVRIAFLSDLHLHEFGTDNVELVDAIRALKPDIIAIGGDMNISGDPDDQVVLTLVRQLVDIAPVYYAMGNHEFNDYLFADSQLPADVKALGATFLSNNYTTIEVSGNLIDIGGLNEMPNHFEEYSQKFYQSYLESENYRLLLAHDPAYFESSALLAGDEIDLALCGHRHGGMVVIPCVGGLYHPGSGLFPDLTQGAHEIYDTWVVISRGLGNSSALPRINNRPELVIIDLY